MPPDRVTSIFQLSGCQGVGALRFCFNFAYQKAAVSASENVEKYVGERMADEDQPMSALDNSTWPLEW
jgi:hypothetical protein